MYQTEVKVKNEEQAQKVREKVKEKIDLIDDFYRKETCPKDIQNYTFLKYLLEKEDVSIAGSAYLFNKKDCLKGRNIDIKTIQSALNLNIDCFAKAIGQGGQVKTDRKLNSAITRTTDTPL